MEITIESPGGEGRGGTTSLNAEVLLGSCPGEGRGRVLLVGGKELDTGSRLNGSHGEIRVAAEVVETERDALDQDTSSAGSLGSSTTAARQAAGRVTENQNNLACDILASIRGGEASIGKRSILLQNGDQGCVGWKVKGLAPVLRGSIRMLGTAISKVVVRTSNVVERGDRGGGGTQTSVGDTPDTISTIVTSRGNNSQTAGSQAISENGNGRGSVGRARSQTHVNDVHALVEGELHTLHDNIRATATSAGEDSVGTEGDLGGNTNEWLRSADLSGISTNDSSNVSSVAVASVSGVRVLNSDAGLVKVVSDKVPTVTDTAALAEASSEGGVSVVDTRVDDTDLDALTSVLERLLNIVDTGHLVRGRQLRAGGILLGEVLLGELVTLNGPDALDAGNLGQIIAGVTRLDLDRGTVELVVLATDLKVETLTAV